MLRVKKLSANAKTPERGTAGAAGYDLFAADTVVVESSRRALIPLDLAFAIPAGHVGLLKSRSSMALRGLDVEAGVIDSDYRGNVQVMLSNNTSCEHATTVHRGDKIAQMVVLPVPSMTVCEVEELDDTERGCGGFGSTG